MLLTISTTHRPATDLGYLLHKNPANVRTVKLAYGQAHVFYPEATDDRCTAALLVEIDPVGLVRGRKGSGGEAPSLGSYVNDRPYVASSFTSVALGQLFRTALAGECRDRPELVDRALPLEVHLPALPCRGGEPLLRSLFEPLGYRVEARPLPLDPRFADWGSSRYLATTLTVEARLADVLRHLYVLLPVLDDDKHYWVTEDEIGKLLARGTDWLAAHPERALITRRYLRYRRHLTSQALARLLDDDQPDPDQAYERDDQQETSAEQTVSLAVQRINAVVAALHEVGARRVVDVGCGEGRLLAALLADRAFTDVTGVDVSPRALAVAARKLRLDRLPEARRQHVHLFQSALTYRDRRLAGYDAATALEVVEHLDPGRLSAFERALFGAARPAAVVMTTPNVEYNPRFETLPAGSLRHRDHRFEWTRAEFRGWAGGVAERHGYRVEHRPVGPDDPEVGAPTQMAVFRR
ncbi:MAG TPA: 3' terminal RNA ribose 2'-O-methyltransferase Hen1 [Acidimicrobiales bacterium]|jgi:3' terminal RNA ribose 2'-O-methyltransferase Hen1|nr:3' terminal RNA ribose 2'-O-methyltransferase Hen1 [Acidimicrobiales bacterium]